MRASEGNAVCAMLLSEVEKYSFQKWMLKGIQLLSEKLGLLKKCCLSLILNHLLIYSEFVKLARLARNSKVY